MPLPYENEIKRKAQNNIALTNPTEEKTKLYEKFRAGMKDNQVNTVQAPKTQMSSMSTSVPSQPNNQQQIQDLFRKMQERMDQPQQQFNYNQYTDPQYQSALASAQRNAQQGNNANMAEMNRRGILNSTITSDRGAEIQQQEMGRVTTEVLPQLIQQAYAQYMNDQQQRQQQFNNMGNIASMLSAEDQRVLDNALRSRQANLDAALRVSDMANAFVNPQEDWSGLMRQVQRGGLTPTAAGKQQQFNQGMATKQFDYAKASDLWERTFKEKSFDQSVQQAAAARGLDYARLNQQQQQFIAESAFREKQLGLDQAKFDYQKDQSLNQSKVNMDEERKGLVDALRTNQVTPEVAYTQIQQDVQLGFYTAEEGEQLKALVAQLTPSLQPAEKPQLTEEQKQTLPSHDEILKMAPNEVDGMPVGSYDWARWYASSQGRLANVDYWTWYNLYGPKLTSG
jgi:hypothetical protein